MSTINVAVKSFEFLSIFIGLLTAFQFGPRTFARALKIEPNHDKPCIVGDAWAEECMSCICLEGRIAVCKPSYCATRLKRDLDDCKEGETTRINCNTCQCKNNVKVCTKNDCGNGEGKGRRTRKNKRKDRRRRVNKGNFL